ncbi:MAG: sigma-70 family RNA polymerase sigma factor [Planctomycetes bacterium]|nr:sigma-70 family RNA polymerase sigma factor [Planctomycetota bacterium]
MAEVTHILNAIRAGQPRAAEELLPLVYNELRRLAAVRIAHERPGQTLQATALVHEAYLRLVGDEPRTQWEHRGHFFAAAAEAMRRILVENARRKRRLRHGGERERVQLAEADVAVTGPADDVLSLDDALRQFERDQPRKAAMVKLRYFAGLSEDDAAAALGISRATASRWWAFSRAWLYERMRGAES